MISSTRSSESASRSSWKEASSVISLSSMPSCSTRTSLTRSKTSSRDAAMSPHLGSIVLRARRCYHAVGKALLQSLDDGALDADGREPDRIGDGRTRRVAVSDHGETAEPEQ